MDPAEQRLFKLKVEDFDHAVSCLIAAPSSQQAPLHEKVKAQQLWLKERPWVSHFVPHLRDVQERLKTFLQSSSVSHALQPAPPVRIGALNLQLASSNPAPQKTPPTMDLLSYIQSKVKIPVYSDPDSDDEPYLGTNLALGGPHGAGAQYIALGRLTSVPVKLRKRSGRRRSRRQRRTPIPSDKESPAPSNDETPLQ